MSIVIFHYGKGSFLIDNEYVSFIFRQANVGVSYFFILSGFVMIVAYGNKGPVSFADYLRNRLARIYPVYLLALFLTFGIELLKNKVVIGNYVLNLLMLQSWVPAKALTTNGPGWSLSVELFFYALLPLLMNRVFSKTKLKFNAFWIVGFWLASQILFHLIVYEKLSVPLYRKSDILFNPIMHLNEFLTGNLAGLFFVSRLKNAQRNCLPAILAILFALVVLLKFPTGIDFHNGFLAVLFVPLIVFIAISNDLVTRTISGKNFVFLGEISFGIYILQSPVMKIFTIVEHQLGLQKHVDFTVLLLVRVTVLIAIAAVSYLYFEKPLRNKIKNAGKIQVLTSTKLPT
ncbi:acyltransferase [Flavobacterium sp. MAH-1]|uniref:Acyltransferase n=2 Tax=Flavobacterium agri TaxID=2743471 RepID=A0A7Y8Y1Q5_9FLAO|nr:acyltransferase [Flavobacterium agri]NYA71009.1 acyltransferase [Flavobacterium agri]